MKHNTYHFLHLYLSFDEWVESNICSSAMLSDLPHNCDLSWGLIAHVFINISVSILADGDTEWHT